MVGACVCVIEGESGENRLLSQKAEPSPEVPTQVKRKEETERNKKDSLEGKGEEGCSTATAEMNEAQGSGKEPAQWAFSVHSGVSPHRPRPPEA